MDYLGRRQSKKSRPSARRSDACIAHLRFPLGHRRVIRTTNLLKRLFGEERRRTKVIPHALASAPS